jgi:flagellar biosynthesis/type III secretory pathway chaperone
MSAEWMKELAGLETILNNIASVIESLAAFEEQKFDALKQVDIKKLMQLNSEEDILVQQMDALDKKRAVSIGRLTRELGIDLSVPLSELIAHFPPDKQEEFQRLRKSIKSRTIKMETTMRENSRMIQSNLNIINFTLNFANRGAVTETYNYRERGEGHKNLHIINRIA